MVQLRKGRSADQYDARVHGQRASSVPPGDLTLNSKVARCTLVTPKYKDGPLYFRPWPALAYDAPFDPVPGRVSAAVGHFSHFMVKVDMASSIGLPDCPRATFILYDPREDHSVKYGNPYRVLFFAATKAKKNSTFGAGRAWRHEQWNKLLDGGQDRGAMLSGPRTFGFFQGHVFRNATTDLTCGERQAPQGTVDEDGLVVVRLPGSAVERLEQLLEQYKSEEQIAGVDAEKEPHKLFRFGDPTGLYDPATGIVRGGVIVQVFNPRVTTRETVLGKDGRPNSISLANQPRQRDAANTRSSWSGDLPKFAGYEVCLNSTYLAETGKVFGASLDAAHVKRVREMFQFWLDDKPTNQPGLLQILPYEQQALLIAKAFANEPELLEFAWADHRSFFTDEVVGVLRQRRQAAVAGLLEDGNPPAADAGGAVAGEADFDTGDLSATAPVAGGATAPAADTGFEEDLDAPGAAQSEQSADASGFADEDAQVAAASAALPAGGGLAPADGDGDVSFDDDIAPPAAGNAAPAGASGAGSAPADPLTQRVLQSAEAAKKRAAARGGNPAAPAKR